MITDTNNTGMPKSPRKKERTRFLDAFKSMNRRLIQKKLEIYGLEKELFNDCHQSSGTSNFQFNFSLNQISNNSQASQEETFNRRDPLNFYKMNFRKKLNSVSTLKLSWVIES
jgi:hypothetical protein